MLKIISPIHFHLMKQTSSFHRKCILLILLYLYKWVVVSMDMWAQCSITCGWTIFLSLYLKFKLELNSEQWTIACFHCDKCNVLTTGLPKKSIATIFQLTMLMRSQHKSPHMNVNSMCLINTSQTGTQVLWWLLKPLSDCFLSGCIPVDLLALKLIPSSYYFHLFNCCSCVLCFIFLPMLSCSSLDFTFKACSLQNSKQKNVLWIAVSIELQSLDEASTYIFVSLQTPTLVLTENVVRWPLMESWLWWQSKK